MRIALASDHAGFGYKSRLVALLETQGHEVSDLGTDSSEPVDYPIFVRRAAEAVAAGRCDRGIVLGGSGNGEAIAANRVRGVRCAVCWSVEAARLARSHNDANMIAIGERLLAFDLVAQMVEAWLVTEFDGGRHVRRLGLIDPPDEDG